MTDSLPQLVADAGCEIGENPLWHPQMGQVFFLDIPRGRINAFDPATGAWRIFSQGRVTGGMLIHEDGSLLLFQDGAISLLGMDGKQRLLIEGVCPGNQRFNDVIADPRGRVFAGTLGGGPGKLYRFDPDGRQVKILDGVGVPNGMGFTPDLKHMYFTDSLPRKLYVFDYDIDTGELTEQREFATVPLEEGVPDGMCVDADGDVWTAVWFGARLKRYAPNGSLDREVRFPVRQTSAITFGGEDLCDMYVTSAATTLADDMLPPGFDKSWPRGGGLYRVRVPSVRGRSPFRSRIRF